jgi:hypothetical protein
MVVEMIAFGLQFNNSSGKAEVEPMILFFQGCSSFRDLVIRNAGLMYRSNENLVPDLLTN